MPPEFLSRLSLQDDEREKLAGLGASTPLAILSMRKASKESFDRFFGAVRADAIAEELQTLLSEEERRRLDDQTSPFLGYLGARLGPPSRQ